ncbi:MAG TPA: hypothetical protein VEK08_06140 [Planctomycetota bacterium]|nr:hypothetical protein [Planctomycetota bacterium]
MKIICWITLCDDDNPAVFAELCKRFPWGKRNSLFLSEYPIEATETNDVLRLLEQQGMRPASRSKYPRSSEEYGLQYRYEYDRSDYEQAELLIPMPKASVGQVVTRSAKGLLKLEGHAYRKAYSIACANWPWRVVSDRVKKAIEDAGLSHAVFRPTDKEDENDRTEGITVWELTSDFILPPLSPRGTAVHNDGTPFSGDYGKGFQLEEGFFSFPELHYTRSSLVEAGPFDFGLTRELYGGDHPRLITSQRFYQLCAKLKIRTEWIPVRIDPN